MLTGRKVRMRVFAVLLALSMLMILPGVSLGAGTLSSLTFVSSSDNNLTTGSGKTIHFWLWDNASALYTVAPGTLPAALKIHINSPSGVSSDYTGSTISNSDGSYTISSAIFSSAGTYTLYVTDGVGSATGAINVTTPSTPPATHNLSYLTFLSTADNNLITGVTQNINYRLWDSGNQQFSGSVSAYIVDPDGHTTSYTASSTSIANVTLDKPGTYTLVLTDTNNYSASGTLTVGDAKVSTSGLLIQNYYSTVTVTLMDASGNPLSHRSLTVDASNVGGTPVPYTTLYDGTFSFSLTPTTLGTVNFNLGGHLIGTMQVSPAYTTGARIGTTSSDNATLSVQVAQQGWAKADTVILTRDDVVADAMVAAPLSKRYDAPILMTPSASLSTSVLSEITTLGAKNVFVIGGTGAVSASVTDTLTSYGLHVTRFDGVDRYATAAKIAAWVSSPGTVYLAYGYGEPDALAAGALAAEQGIPILLSDTNVLPEVTQDQLATLRPKTVVLLGGTGVLSSDLQTRLAGQYSVQRWGGVDRYATEQVIFQNFFNQKPALDQYPLFITSSYVSPSDVSSGNPYGDALVTAALAAKKNGFVVTLPPNSLPNTIGTFLLFNKGYIPSATVVGNSSAIGFNLEQQLQQLLAH